MDLRFTKMHGLGNDFVLIDDLDRTWDLDPDAVRLLCDRHFGIGGDGLILVRPATLEGADFFMLYFNADGTTAEMCGNGVRCFAKWVVDRGHVAGDTVRVQTLGGIKQVEVERGADGLMTVASVDMGEPVLDPLAIPTTFDGDRVLERPLATPLGTFEVTAVSMGNPHAVIWVDDLDDAPVESLGPVIERDPHFPAKTNVEFAQLVAEELGLVRLRVWERGVGETLACGTGACATAVAGALSGRTGRTVTVELPGGELSVTWAPDGHVHMTGIADEVFTGVFAIVDEDEDPEP
jgi:diaminopimelate epimerase